MDPMQLSYEDLLYMDPMQFAIRGPTVHGSYAVCHTRTCCTWILCSLSYEDLLYMDPMQFVIRGPAVHGSYADVI